MAKKEIIDLRLVIKGDDPVHDSFMKIKESMGIKNNSEVLRFILKQVSKVSFSEFMNSIEVSQEE